MSAQDYLDFFIAAGDNQITSGKVVSQTLSGMGYNLLDNRTERFYLHTGADHKLKLGSKRLFTYTASSRCKGRMDVINSIEFDSFEGFINALWDDKNARSSLIKNYIQGTFLSALIEKKIKEKSKSHHDYQQLLSELDRTTAKIVVAKMPDRLAPWGLNYTIPEKKICLYTMECWDSISGDEFEQLRDYTKRYGYTAAGSLLELFYGQPNDNNTHAERLSAAADFLGGKSNFFIERFVVKAWSNPNKRAWVTNQLSGHKLVGKIICKKALEDTPTNGPELNAYCRQLTDPKLVSAIQETSPLELLPWYVEFGVSEEKVCRYIATSQEPLTEDSYKQFKEVITGYNYQAAGSMLELLYEQADNCYFPVEALSRALDLLKGHQPTIEIFLAKIWNNEDRKVRAANQLWDNFWAGDIIKKKIIAKIPTVGVELNAYCQKFKSSGLITVIQQACPLKRMPWYIEFGVPEEQICRYIATYQEPLAEESYKQFKDVITKNKYQAAGCMLELLYEQAGSCRFPIKALSRAVDILKENKPIIEHFLTKIWDDEDKKVLVANQLWDNFLVGDVIKQKIIVETPTTGTELNAYCQKFKESGLIDIIKDSCPLELMPWYIEFGVSEEQTCCYLITGQNCLKGNDYQQFKEYMAKYDFQVAGSILDLLYGDLTDDCFPVKSLPQATKIFKDNKSIFKSFLKKIWDDETKKVCVARKLWNLPEIGGVIQQKVVEQIPNNGPELNAYCRQFAGSGLIDIIQDACPPNQLSWHMEFNVSPERVCRHIATCQKPIAGEEFNRFLAFAEQKGSIMVGSLLNFLYGQPREHSFSENGLAMAVDLIARDKSVLNIFLQKTWSDEETWVRVVNQLCNHRLAGEAIRKKVINHIPTTGSKLKAYCQQFKDPSLIHSIQAASPLELLPWHMEFGVSEQLLCCYLATCENAIAAKQFHRFKKFSVQHNYMAADSLLEFLYGQPDACTFDQKELVRAVSLFATDLKILKHFLENIWDHPPKSIQIANLLCNHKVAGTIVREKVIALIPETGPELNNYCRQFNDSTLVSEIQQASPLNLLSWYMEFGVSEELICHYITKCCPEVQTPEIEKLYEYTVHSEFIEAKLLLDIVRIAGQSNGYLGKGRNISSIVRIFKSFTEDLFKKHSQDLSLINISVLRLCNMGGDFEQSSRLKQLSFCEGLHCHDRKKQETYTLCRRNRCKIALDDVSEKDQFSLVVGNYLGISKAQLHQHEDFIRSIAALNRWDEILHRLQCQTCNNPLTLSEHAKNSVGQMAYTATFWHCSNIACEEYCRSIKLTHCLGCRHVIDSRMDQKSCNPWEVRSYKKFYICSHCASCCQSHAGFSGRCPKCGIEKAYSQVDASRRNHARCRNCQHEVSIEQRNYERIATPIDKNILSQSPSSLLFPKKYLSSREQGRVVHDWPWDWTLSYLYVYDLFDCLKSGHLSLNQITRYEKVYDLKVMERLVYLGLTHERYGPGAHRESLLPEVFKKISAEYEMGLISDEVARHINDLMGQMNAQNLWPHYELELSFTLALYSLCGSGIQVDSQSGDTIFTKSQRARDILVEQLRVRGIYTPARQALVDYVENHYNQEDKTGVSLAIKRSDYKGFQSSDVLCRIMHKIEKVERAVSVCGAMMRQPSWFIPDYQIIGSETSRCTSRSPNLLGLPKELRPIIRARAGFGIVECDYGQMEVGVMAALSGDTALIKDYNSGDVYQELATSMSLTREQAKLMFLSILYGVGETTLAAWLGISRGKAKGIVAAFFQRYPDVSDYQDKMVTEAQRNGHAISITGLRRWVNKAAFDSAPNRVELERWHKNWFRNFPVQAAAATVFKRAVIDIAENVVSSGLKLIAPMYDSIAFEVPLAELEQNTELVTTSMKRSMRFYFPCLDPQIKVNNFDISCWNAGEGVIAYEEWLDTIADDIV